MQAYVLANAHTKNTRLRKDITGYLFCWTTEQVILNLLDHQYDDDSLHSIAYQDKLFRRLNVYSLSKLSNLQAVADQRYHLQ